MTNEATFSCEVIHAPEIVWQSGVRKCNIKEQ